MYKLSLVSRSESAEEIVLEVLALLRSLGHGSALPQCSAIPTYWRCWRFVVPKTITSKCQVSAINPDSLRVIHPSALDFVARKSEIRASADEVHRRDNNECQHWNPLFSNKPVHAV
jgi:hypothetical protein